ncbi:MAG: hypothetical protein ACKN89_11830 [Cyanobium sp.]|jgi:hypothetical protein
MHHHLTASPTAPVPDPVSGVEELTAAKPAATMASATHADAQHLIAELECFVDHAYADPASGGEHRIIRYGFTSIDGLSIQPGDSIRHKDW